MSAARTAAATRTAAVPRTRPAPRIAVVGSGIAGLYAALLAADGGAQVTLLSKGRLEQSNTYYAQGGICAVLPEEQAASGDSVAAHVQDTLRAGGGLSDRSAAELLCAAAEEEIAQLGRFGVKFDGSSFGPDGFYALGLEAAHSAPRILHAGGDATGASLANALIAAVRERETAGIITVVEHTFLTDILRSGDRAAGVAVLRDGAAEAWAADAVVLATGGAGELFEHTTNPATATADGLTAAWRAGAVLQDLEFFQFHPTALDAPGNFMISEAVRGEGAVLRNAGGNRFLQQVHPDAELAPRDVVARGITDHLRALADAGQPPQIYLDATGVAALRGADYLARRFPTIDACTRALGFDWNTEWLPVSPAAHYWMGGVRTDLAARTSVRDLYAAGEVACTGVNGANRLASNSLLEGLVFARRAVRDILAAEPTAVWPHFEAEPLLLAEPAGEDGRGGARHAGEVFDRAALQRLMSANAAVVREEAGLAVAAKQLQQWHRHPQAVADYEDANLLLAARLLVTAARQRTESVGAHFRADFPQHDWSNIRHLSYVNAAH